MTGSEVRFVVRLTPRGGADRVDGVGEDGLLRARVAAPPVDDAANLALVRLIARELGLPRTAVRIAAGSDRPGARRWPSRGCRPAAILARWPGLGL